MIEISLTYTFQGAFAVAKSLISLGKRVVIVTDECNELVLLAAAASLGSISGSAFRLESFPVSVK